VETVNLPDLAGSADSLFVCRFSVVDPRQLNKKYVSRLDILYQQINRYDLARTDRCTPVFGGFLQLRLLGRAPTTSRIHRLQGRFERSPIQRTFEFFQKLVGRNRRHQAVQKSELGIGRRMHNFLTSCSTLRSKVLFRSLKLFDFFSPPIIFGRFPCEGAEGYVEMT
jgi:hypothetical protein